ncbi:helix-turn-helix transcriptional regulator [Povalibacter sp.]|uniref:helix-turn-helix transcriptional regulator n=1 Tax=Povalibacter sp. TaxID=1962978 RepID=UPI002F42B1CD
MEPYELAESFLDHCERSTRIADLAFRFQNALEDLGFRYYACSSHVDPLRPDDGIMVLNYPPTWVEWYSEQQLHLIDPVFRCADRTRRPFYWDDPLFRKAMSARQHKMQVSAQQFGVAHGFTIPIHGPRGTASCSVVPDSPKMDRRRYLAVEIMCVHLFNRIEHLRTPVASLDLALLLSPRERQSMDLVAIGKSDEELARLLGIRTFTAHEHIENAKKRLGFCSRTAAVVYALGIREIRLEDAMRILTPTARQNRR